LRQKPSRRRESLLWKKLFQNLPWAWVSWNIRSWGSIEKATCHLLQLLCSTEPTNSCLNQVHPQASVSTGV
jgi:hypothetical protein